MNADIRIPDLAESVAEARILSWLKQAGDTVSEGEKLVEVETDKVVLEVTAPASGRLAQVLKGPGDAADSGEVIGTVDTQASAETTPTAAAAPDPAEQPATTTASAGPSARRALTEHDVDATAISGSGPHGRITRQDVDKAARKDNKVRSEPPVEYRVDSRPEHMAGERREPMSRLRATVARRLLEAQHNAAILTTFNEINMQPMMALRKDHQQAFTEKYGVKLGFMSFFVKAAVNALQKFPAINAFIDGDDIVYHDCWHIGMAIGSPRGLLVPVLQHAETMSFADIEHAIVDFAARAVDGQIRPEELAGGTFTITNGGVFGSMLSTPIVNPPQSGILGLHKIQQRPVAENGEVVIRPVMYVALSYDHRIVDGREAVQFLVAIKDTLEDPDRLLLSI